VKDFGVSNYAMQAAAFSPDGKLLAVGYSRGPGRRREEDEPWLRIFDVATGKVQKTLEGHASSVLTIAFSPDGRFLATGSQDTTVLLWELDRR
jgi:WD40 repeat protein